MSNHRKVAELIPQVHRQYLLTDNIIYKAIVAANDTHMAILVIMYNNYIFNEGEKINMNNPCLACLSKILDTFKLIEPDLKELEYNYQLLNCI